MKKNLAAVILISMFCAASAGAADLPPGPIHDRHELMEGVGDNAKKIGDAMKAGKPEDVAEPAAKIHADAGKALALFPEGSTHEKSRAKPEIWQDWAKFESLMKDMEAKAGELAAASKSGGDVGAASKAMFGNCKSCHDQFRKPEEKEKG